VLDAVHDQIIAWLEQVDVLGRLKAVGFTGEDAAKPGRLSGHRRGRSRDHAAPIVDRSEPRHRGKHGPPKARWRAWAFKG
jgi:hypothetical protein